MRNIKKKYIKSFIRAAVSAICLVTSMLIVYSFSKQTPPNLFLLGLGVFTGLYLISLLGYKIMNK